jgi:hypothetical protein
MIAPDITGGGLQWDRPNWLFELLCLLLVLLQSAA